eukprot:13403745-Ditylum_brightwellii.AAC.1
MLDTEYFNKFEAFPALRRIPMYGTTYKYTEQITSNVSTIMNENEKKYTSPPSNAWSRGPPKATKQLEQNSQVQTNRTKQNNKSNDDYKSLKESMEKSQKQQEETLAKINKKLDQKMSTTKDTIWSLIKEILQKELAEILPEIIREVLEEIKLSKTQIKDVKYVQVQTPTISTDDTCSQLTEKIHSNNGGSQYEKESNNESESSESEKEDDESAEEEESPITQPEVGKDVSTETDNDREPHAQTQIEESPPQKKTMSTAMGIRK